MDFKGSQNIFLRAALTGEVSPWNTCSSSSVVNNNSASCTSTSSNSLALKDDTTQNNNKTRPKKGPSQRISFSETEDMLIQAAYKRHKGDHRAMVAFITKHRELLPPEGCIYYERTIDQTDKAKAAEERVRKRVAAKLLQASR